MSFDGVTKSFVVPMSRTGQRQRFGGRNVVPGGIPSFAKSVADASFVDDPSVTRGAPCTPWIGAGMNESESESVCRIRRPATERRGYSLSTPKVSKHVDEEVLTESDLKRSISEPQYPPVIPPAPYALLPNSCMCDSALSSTALVELIRKTIVSSGGDAEVRGFSVSGVFRRWMSGEVVSDPASFEVRVLRVAVGSALPEMGRASALEEGKFVVEMERHGGDRSAFEAVWRALENAVESGEVCPVLRLMHVGLGGGLVCGSGLVQDVEEAMESKYEDEIASGPALLADALVSSRSPEEAKATIELVSSGGTLDRLLKTASSPSQHVVVVASAMAAIRSLVSTASRCSIPLSESASARLTALLTAAVTEAAHPKGRIAKALEKAHTPLQRAQWKGWATDAVVALHTLAGAHPTEAQSRALGLAAHTRHIDPRFAQAATGEAILA